MKKIVHLLVFKIGFDTIASLELDKQTIFDVENFKSILASQHNVCPDDIDVSQIQKEKKEPLSADLFISVTGKLCFYNDFWNVEVVEGFSMVDWVDLNTEEGINTISDYIFMNKLSFLVQLYHNKIFFINY